MFNRKRSTTGHKRTTKEVVNGLVDYINREEIEQISAVIWDEDEVAIVKKQLKECKKIITRVNNHKKDSPLEVACEIEKIIKKHKANKQNITLNNIIKSLNRFHDEIMLCPEYKSLSSRISNIDILSYKGNISLSDDISQHSALLYQIVYSKPHLLDDEHYAIARDLHGIQHVNRVAYYIPILADLYERHGDEEAKLLTDEDIKLIQIAALLHDVAREKGTGVDYWDQESALLAYYYFKDLLDVPEEKARKIAEAIANKDTERGHYFKLTKNEHDELVWEVALNEKRNIYQKLLHDADSLDIIRARKIYKAEHLDFYKDIGIHNEEAKAEMLALVCEVRSLIEYQGDGYLRQNDKIKRHLESKDGYHLTREFVTSKSNELPVLNYKYSPAKPYNPQNELTEENMRAALLQHGKNGAPIVFSRSVKDPSAVMTKHNETLAEIELRKVLRRPDVPTRFSKKLGKEGNPNRSVAMLGFGFGGVDIVPYASAGYLIVHSDKTHDKIQSINLENVFSGYGSKKDIADKVKILTDEDKKKRKLNKMIDTLEMGTYSNDTETSHNEIIYHVKNYDAIFYTNDPVFGNYYLNEEQNPSPPYHKNSALLQAIFLQKQYEKETGKSIPIFEYSGIHNHTNKQATLTDQQIVRLWVDMCQDSIQAKKPGLSELTEMSLDSLKVFSMYGTLETGFNDNEYDLLPADNNYSETLRNAIDQGIREMILEEANNYVTKYMTEIQDKTFPSKRTFLKEYLEYVNQFDIENDLPNLLIKMIKNDKDLELMTIANIDNEDVRQHARTVINTNANKSSFRIYLKHANSLNIPIEEKIQHLAETKSNAPLPSFVLTAMIDLFEEMPHDANKEMLSNMLAILNKIDVHEQKMSSEDIPNLLVVLQKLSQMAQTLHLELTDQGLDFLADGIPVNSDKTKYLSALHDARSKTNANLSSRVFNNITNTSSSLFHHLEENKKNKHTETETVKPTEGLQKK